jgi:hypothetical protein
MITPTLPGTVGPVIGYGSIARIHQQVLNGRPDKQVTAVVSRQTPELPGCTHWYESLQAMSAPATPVVVDPSLGDYDPRFN